MGRENVMEVKFYDTVNDELLKFAVVISQSNGKWVFCKHKERDTYEVPGGHRETGENILETAKRELQEETGAVKYEIKPICVYSVIGKTRVNNVYKRFAVRATMSCSAGSRESMYASFNLCFQ